VVPQPDKRLAVVAAGAGDRCDPAEPVAQPARYAPVLEDAPLTMAGTTGRVRRGATQSPRDDDRRWESFDASGPASSAIHWEDRHVVPAISLHEKGTGRTWHPRRELLGSDAFRAEFVAEVDAAGRANLRFGDDTFGMRPAADSEFRASYRVGNGPTGNVGAGALHHIVIDDGRVTAVRNPMPARGGVAPETIEHVRRIAPAAFRVNQRAVTPDDYAEVAGRQRQVQRAQATERWTGSWHTIFLSIDRTGGLPVDDAFEGELRDHLERYRMAGHDVEIDGPRFVWLELELRVCVLPAYYRGDVRRELLEVFGAGAQADGRLGIFHPDNFTFGQSVYLSRIYAAAQAVPGVRMVEALVFRRLGEQKSPAIDTGELTIDRLEVARLDNDPNFPDRGVIRLEMEGGQ
jgi:predicted phage baseplate assembly protein